jgi:hypothetical protein
MALAAILMKVSKVILQYAILLADASGRAV